MTYSKITAIAFSPCFTTEKCARILGETLAEELDIPFEQIRFTTPKDRAKLYEFGAEDLVIVASPTYAGKLPNKIMPDLKSQITGHNATAIALVTFGNRAYDNSLAELSVILKENGFALIAGAALVNEHSFAHTAEGRPKLRDLDAVKDFAKHIADKIGAGNTTEPAIPGDADAPYYVPKMENGEPAKFLPAKPKTDPAKCDRCGMCVRACPMGSINADDPSDISGICIKCHACVNRCTKNAKYFDDSQLLSHIAMLQRDHADDKENEFFL